MSPAESQLLRNFLNQLTLAGRIPKEPEADSLIAAAIAKQPDAAYLLVQRAMLLEQALNNAKGQIAQLQTELQAARSPGGGSFLDSGSVWGRSSGDAVTPPSTPAGAGTQSASKPSFLGGGGGSFLGTLAATAAGVAGGAFLFQGIENLLGHRGTILGSAGAGPDITENVTVNNYFSDDKASIADDADGVTDVDYQGDDSSDDSSWI